MKNFFPKLLFFSTPSSRTPYWFYFNVRSGAHTASNTCYQQCWQHVLPTVLATRVTDSVGNTCYQQCWQHVLPTVLATRVTDSVGNTCYWQCWQHVLPTVLATRVTNSVGNTCYQQCWQQCELVLTLFSTESEQNFFTSIMQKISKH